MFKLADLMERDTEKLAQLERCVSDITSVADGQLEHWKGN